MRIILFQLVFAFFAVTASAQINSGIRTPISDRLTFGGDFGANFGTITYINISPLVGYRFTDHFTGGVGFIYQYLEYNKSVYGFDFKTTTFGERIFGRYRFLENFYGTMEYQNLNLDSYDLNLNSRGRINVPVLFVGGGYLQLIGGRSYVSLSLLYDVIEDFNSPYGNPLLQVGFIVNP